MLSASASLEAEQPAPVLPYDMGMGPSAGSTSSSSWIQRHTNQQEITHRQLQSWLSDKFRGAVNRRRSLLQLGMLGSMSNILSSSGISSADMSGGSGAGGDVYTTDYNSLMGGDSTDALMQQVGVLGYNSLLNSYPATSGSYQYGAQGLQDPQVQQRFINAGSQFAGSIAPAKAQAYNTVQYVTQSTQPMVTQAHQDISGLAMQAAAAVPSAQASMVEGAGTVISTVQPYIQNGQTGPVDVATRAVISGAAAKQQFMHGTAVPMTSGAITAAADIGNHLGTGFKEGFPEGYQAAMDRRPPYAVAKLQKQRYEQQPALYLPNSFAPLGAMANVTYPCPQGLSGTTTVTAPVGTIIGPGIPCGVNIMLVPRTAVPTNQYAPIVVQPVPTSQPVSEEEMVG